jgi:hypothetical protein
VRLDTPFMLSPPYNVPVNKTDASKGSAEPGYLKVHANEYTKHR